MRAAARAERGDDAREQEEWEKPALHWATHYAELPSFLAGADEDENHFHLPSVAVSSDLSLPHGVRSTAQRRAVVEAVGGWDGSFTVAELHERARTLEPRLGLATTYRTLELLRASGAVHPLLAEGRHAYVRCRPEHHHHLVCT